MKKKKHPKTPKIVKTTIPLKGPTDSMEYSDSTSEEGLEGKSSFTKLQWNAPLLSINLETIGKLKYSIKFNNFRCFICSIKRKEEPQ